MDWAKIIIKFLGLQDVELIDAKLFTKDSLKAEIVVHQIRDKGARCRRCRGELGNLKEWFWRRDIKVPPMGVFQNVRVRLLTFRAECRKCVRNHSAEVEWVHPRHSKVLFNSVGRGKAALRECFSVLSSGQKMAVEWFCCDMHQPFISGAKTHLPNAKICVDRFHVVQLANKAFDQVRKDEFRRAEDKFHKDMLLRAGYLNHYHIPTNDQLIKVPAKGSHK